MIAGRLRSGPAADFLIALVFLASTVGVGALIVHELTALRSPGRAQLPSRAPSVEPSASGLSIAVSVLPLADGQELRVGDSLEKAERVLAGAVRVGPESADQGPIGRRLTRRYQHGSINFTLVLEPFQQNGPMRVAAIYIR